MFCIIARHAHGLFDGSIARQPTSVGATGSFFQIVPSFYKHLTLIVSESNLILTHEQLSLLVFSYICVKLTDTSIVIDDRYTIKVTIMYIKQSRFFRESENQKCKQRGKYSNREPARNYREWNEKWREKEKDSDVWWSRGGVPSVKEFDEENLRRSILYVCKVFDLRGCHDVVIREDESPFFFYSDKSNQRVHAAVSRPNCHTYCIHFYSTL